MARLDRAGLLDDADFAAEMGTVATRVQRRGRIALKQELRSKGLTPRSSTRRSATSARIQSGSTPCRWPPRSSPGCAWIPPTAPNVTRRSAGLPACCRARLRPVDGDRRGDRGAGHPIVTGPTRTSRPGLQGASSSSCSPGLVRLCGRYPVPKVGRFSDAAISTSSGSTAATLRRPVRRRFSRYVASDDRPKLIRIMMIAMTISAGM